MKRFINSIIMLIVIFSFNRAMQLDYLIKSIFAKVKIENFEIAVIFHYTGEHSKGYQKLQEKYANSEKVTFYERKPNFFNTKFLYNFDNFKLLLKNVFLYKQKIDNFKYLLESILKTTNCDYIMFNTDDGFFYDDVEFPQNIKQMIADNPLQTSYRLYVGDNLDDFPNYLSNIEGLYYKWNYYERKELSHWTYPFAVDATIYHRKTIVEILRKVFYHNPITLESHGLRYVKRHKLLSVGLSPIASKTVGTTLNRVSTSTSNPTIHIDVDYLNQKYLQNFELELELPAKITNANLVPLTVYLTKDSERELIYTLDDKGKDVQNALKL